MGTLFSDLCTQMGYIHICIYIQFNFCDSHSCVCCFNLNLLCNVFIFNYMYMLFKSHYAYSISCPLYYLLWNYHFVSANTCVQTKCNQEKFPASLIKVFLECVQLSLCSYISAVSLCLLFLWVSLLLWLALRNPKTLVR